MNKSPKLYTCECCSYTSIKRANLVRHIASQHTDSNIQPKVIQKIESTEQVQIDRLKAENEKLKAEIETLKANHKIELMELKLSMYENQIIKPSRKSISPAKPDEKPEKIPKKPHNMPPLEYLNKYFPPHEHNMLDEIIGEKLRWENIPISLSNLEQQYVSILKPLMEEYKIVFHSGEKNHSLKFYYINHENKWVEDLTDMEYMFYLIERKIDYAFLQKIEAKEFNADEQMDLMLHYNNTKFNRNYVVKQLLDVMKLPE